MATESRWTRPRHAFYLKEFRRDAGWQLFHEVMVGARPRWVVLMPGGIAPLGQQYRNDALSADQVDEAQEWADKIIDRVARGLRDVPAKRGS
jgi:hypothetical protein